MKISLNWFNAENDDMVDEIELSELSQEQIREWFFLFENEDISGVHLVQATQRQHLAKFVEMDLNKYDYFLEVSVEEVDDPGENRTLM